MLRDVLQVINWGWVLILWKGGNKNIKKIAKYAENTTFQNRWPMIFRHEYIQLIFLRENGYDNVSYKKKSSKYVPEYKENTCKSCCLELSSGLCSLCDNNMMKRIVACIEN